MWPVANRQPFEPKVDTPRDAAVWNVYFKLLCCAQMHQYQNTPCIGRSTVNDQKDLLNKLACLQRGHVI